MLFQKLLFMSLLSLLFGCGTKSGDKDKFPQVPYFPQTDNPACRVEPAPMDTGFYAQSFIIAPDKQHVYVLACGMAGTPEKMPYQLLRLDAAGQAQRKVEMPDCQWADTPCFWWENDGKLSLLLNDVIKTLDPDDLQLVKEWQQMDLKNFLPQKKMDQLTYDEQVLAYDEALQNAAGKSRTAYVLQVWNLHYLMLDFKGQPAQSWHLWNDEDIEQAVARYGLRKGASYPAEQPENDLISDENARLTLLTHEVLDYKMAYPNLKYIEMRVLALTAGKQTARFKLSNKNNRSLFLQYADNQRLTTADGTAWLLFEGVLYRVGI